jgi:hypothetical protein
MFKQINLYSNPTPNVRRHEFKQCSAYVNHPRSENEKEYDWSAKTVTPHWTYGIPVRLYLIDIEDQAWPFPHQ